MPEDIDPFVRVGVDKVNTAVFLQMKTEPDDFSVDPGQDGLFIEVEQGDGLFEGGALFHDEGRPVDNDFNRF